MFTEAIKYAEEQIEFHRSKMRSFLRWVWGLAILILITIILFAGYTDVMLKTVAQMYIETSLKIANTPPSVVDFPDFVGLINENYFGYWAVSGFVLALFASLGMLKYHAGRMAYLEAEVLNLNRLQSISNVEPVKSVLGNKVIEFSLLANTRSDVKVVVNPILDAISENTSKIIDKLSKYKP